jgi:peroxiredoxin
MLGAMRIARVIALIAVAAMIPIARAQTATLDAKAIDAKLRTLRSLDDTTRAQVTRQLAESIHALPEKQQAGLASALANLTTEGDFGRDTLQYVTMTLASAVRDTPLPAQNSEPAEPYFQLAKLSRYEHMQVDLKDPQYDAAMKQLVADDTARGLANFTLRDLSGTAWTLRDLRGKVVLLNFWATWCPPCLKEMPDLDAIYKRFHDRGLVILAVSDEEANVVKPFIANQQKVSYPILLDPGLQVTAQFRVEGIPKTFIYNREGKLAAQSIDMRTMNQFLAMLKQAGME